MAQMGNSPWLAKGGTSVLGKTYVKPTLAQILQQQAEKRKEEAEKEMRKRAWALVYKIESQINGTSSNKTENFSRNYAGDSQYEVTGTWTDLDVSLAYQFWCALYNDNHAEAEKAQKGSGIGNATDLKLHYYAASEKWSGDRNGARQANFIRLKMVGGDDKHNVHVNVEAPPSAAAASFSSAASGST